MLSKAPEARAKAVPSFRLDGAAVAPGGLKGGAKTKIQNLLLFGNRSYHISNAAGFVGIVRTVDAIGALARDHGPGSYVVDEHFPDLLHNSVDSSRGWGKVIHHLDGKVVIHVDPR